MLSGMEAMADVLGQKIFIKLSVSIKGKNYTWFRMASNSR